MGRTPLIKLSPKKTWEGFIGGAAVTLFASWYLAAFMSRYQWMTCERNVRHNCPPLLKTTRDSCMLPPAKNSHQ